MCFTENSRGKREGERENINVENDLQMPEVDSRTREKICMKSFPTSCCLAVLQMTVYMGKGEKVDRNKSPFTSINLLKREIYNCCDCIKFTAALFRHKDRLPIFKFHFPFKNWEPCE